VPSPTPTRSPESFVSEAQDYFKNGKLIPAIASYQQAIISNPQDPAVYVALARVQVFAGQYQAAEESARSAILLNNDNSMAHAVLGWALGFQEKYIEAEDSIKTALSLDANNALAHAYYVEILVGSGSFDVLEKAIEESKVAIALDPNALETHRARGIIYEATQNYDEAIGEFNQAITINPKIPDLYLKRGLNYRAIGSYVDAINDFNTADSLNPDDPTPDYYISRTYATSGEYGKAMQYAESAVANNPVDTNLHGNLGVMYYRNSYLTEAIEQFGYVIHGGFTSDGKKIEPMELVPNNVYIAQYYAMYGLALAKTNKCGEALDIARTIFERIPGDEDAVFNANAIVSRCQQNLEQTAVPNPTSTETGPASTETPTPAP
jgi:tetratricopeptide (TPR) repeat protein